MKVHNCSAERCGIGCDDPELGICKEPFDAVFICIEDESKAAVQAAKLGKLLPSTPVVVRTEDSRSGLGSLLRLPNGGGLGANIIAVGFQDIILDPEMALHPKQELIAQACHEGYLHGLREQISKAENEGDVQKAAALRSKSAYVPWDQLTEDDRLSNRKLVRFYSRHLEQIDSKSKPKAYGLFERVTGHLSEAPPALFEFSSKEIEYLAEEEHKRWMEDKDKDGWEFGREKDAEKKIHHCLVPYGELKESDKDLDRDIFRKLPVILARANIFIKPIDENSKSAEEG